MTTLGGHDAAGTKRRSRDRARTEANLLDAAQRLFTRDGVLAGLNLNEVATEAMVNRGRIYQMYGSRRALLRAAINRALTRLRTLRPDHWDADFAERKRAAMRDAVGEQQLARLAMLLVLDGDENFHVFPSFELTRLVLDRDKRTGALPADADGEALHVLINAACMGYAVVREQASRDTGIPLDELDQRVIATFDRIVGDVAGEAGKRR